MLKQPTRDPSVLLDVIGSLVEVSPEDLSQRDRELLRSLGEWERFVQTAPARCDLVRLGIPDHDSVNVLAEIVDRSPMPVIADIHFNTTIALQAVRAGAHKIRINPGNISDEVFLCRLARECTRRSTAIRVGVNTGSLEKKAEQQFKGDIISASVESAVKNEKRIRSAGAASIVVSLKASSPLETIRANEQLADRIDSPLHLGVTEAGVGADAVVRSWVGIGALLSRGIGDTIRISLTESPLLEVVAAHLLLTSLGLR